jgi:multiple sugar transport system permease protein
LSILKTLNIKESKPIGKKRKRTQSSSALAALPWIGPALILIVMVVIWPVVELIRASFTNISNAGSFHGFTGLTNFRDLITNPDLKPVISQSFSRYLLLN